MARASLARAAGARAAAGTRGTTPLAFGRHGRRRRDPALPRGGHQRPGALLPLGWPLVGATTLHAWWRNRGRLERVPEAARCAIFARVNLAWGTLVGKHLFWVIEKQRDLAANRAWLKSLTRATQG